MPRILRIEGVHGTGDDVALGDQTDNECSIDADARVMECEYGKNSAAGIVHENWSGVVAQVFVEEGQHNLPVFLVNHENFFRDRRARPAARTAQRVAQNPTKMLTDQDSPSTHGPACTIGDMSLEVRKGRLFFRPSFPSDAALTTIIRLTDTEP